MCNSKVRCSKWKKIYIQNNKEILLIFLFIGNQQKCPNGSSLSIVDGYVPSGHQSIVWYSLSSIMTKTAVIVLDAARWRGQVSIYYTYTWYCLSSIITKTAPLCWMQSGEEGKCYCIGLDNKHAHNIMISSPISGTSSWLIINALKYKHKLLYYHFADF